MVRGSAEKLEALGVLHGVGEIDPIDYDWKAWEEIQRWAFGVGIKQVVWHGDEIDEHINPELNTVVYNETIAKLRCRYDDWDTQLCDDALVYDTQNGAYVYFTKRSRAMMFKLTFA